MVKDNNPIGRPSVRSARNEHAVFIGRQATRVSEAFALYQCNEEGENE